jgi:SAM-dependent methyltransferase
MDHHLQTNLAHWNELTPLHARSAFYDLKGFKAGKSSLKPIEVLELGDVTAKSLLHLQCHLGVDTLSWARRGARVTGVDFSDQAIATARALSQELDIAADFVCSDIYSLPANLSGEFDIVFTSYGVLCWLPDLVRWGQVVAHFLKKGGTFYIVEEHPLANILEDDATTGGFKIAYSYFHSPEPCRWESEGSYADRTAIVEHRTTYEWTHSLSDILNALTAAGLRIEFLHEFPYLMYGKLACMEEGEDGWWRFKDRQVNIPLIFSLKAVK